MGRGGQRFTGAGRTWLARSYVARHWRGELSLPVSLIVNIAAVNVATHLLSYAAIEAAPDRTMAWAGFAFDVAYWAVLFLLSVWQYVGAWRSARNHKERGGRAAWAVAAQCLLLIGALSVASMYVRTALPQLYEAYQVAIGDPKLGGFALRLLNDGTEVELTGGIGYGAAPALARLLDAQPRVRVIHLDSHGGRAEPAHRLRDLIAERGLDTYVFARCESACTFVFLGGRERYLNRNARIGFHRATGVGLSESAEQESRREVAAGMVARGVSPDFAERAVVTVGEEMWYPSHDELVAAGFATRRAAGQFAMSGFGADPQREQVADWLRRFPLYPVLEELEPERFARLVDSYHRAFVQGRPENELFAAVFAIVNPVIAHYAATADGEALLAMARALMRQLREHAALDPAACGRFLVPRPGESGPLLAYLSYESIGETLSAAERVVRSGAAGGGAALSSALLAAIEAQQGSALAAEVRALWRDPQSLVPERACALTLEIYRTAIQLPQSVSALLLRHLLAKQYGRTAPTTD